MSGRAIDRFIDAMLREGGDELLLETGQTVRISACGVERNLLAQSVRTHQIENLIAEVVPVDCLRRFRQDGEISFPYNAVGGPVTCRSYRRGNNLSVTISPYRRKSSLSVGQMAVGADEFVLEAPLDNVMVNSNHGMSIVTGRPASDQPQARAQAPRAQPAPLAPAPRANAPVARIQTVQRAVSTARGGLCPAPGPESEGPMELDMGSVAPPMPLPSDAFMPNKPSIRPVSAQNVPEQGPIHGGQSALQAVTMGQRRPPAAANEAAFPPPRRHEAQAPQPRPPPPAASAQIEYDDAECHGGPYEIDPILRVLAESGGSDLHLTSAMPPKMRMDGEICDVPGWSDTLTSEIIERWCIEIAPPGSRRKFAEDNDADYAHEIPGVSRFRVNLFRDRRGVGTVLRTIPADVLTAEQLGLPPVVRSLCDLEKGLVTVTGPTGSGKSTTLAAMIDLINKTRADHIITIEDPVEFVHQPQRCLINQREVHIHTKSFSSALRAALREDPDIILVGEMRDLETISIALETAETGHLVFGTLHTNTAVSTVDRIIDQFPSDRQSQIRVMLSESLRGVIAQTLCKKIGGGRVAALEILIGVKAVANLIREGKTFQIASMLQTGKNVGMQTMNDSLLKLVQAGQVEPKEAYRKSVSKTEMKSALDRLGVAYT